VGRFSNKVGFVTGGGTGIGFACAAAIVEGGGSVVIAGRREAPLQAAVELLGSRASFVQCDVAKDADVEAALAAVKERHGALHLAVNAAGTGAVGSVLNGPTDDFERVMQTNLTGAYRCIRAEAKLMNASGGGSIVSISSIAGTHTHHWMTAYCVSKAGLNMLTRCAADDLGKHGIRVNAVAPDGIATPRMTSVSRNAPTIHAAPASHGNMPGSRHARPSRTQAASSASPIAYGSRSANSNPSVSMRVRGSRRPRPRLRRATASPAG
jgi:NAD(P)-dependent dehydrogenase (short-subunit alcohol dehydrogenase family)